MRCAIVITVSRLSSDYIYNGALILLESLRLTNPGLPVVLLHDGLSDEQLQILRCNESICVTDSCFSWMEPGSAIHRPDLNLSVYLRFEVDRINNYDRLLYIDCDTVVVGDLRPVLLGQMQGVIGARYLPMYPLAGQFRGGLEFLSSIASVASISPHLGMYNAGVLLIDLANYKLLSIKRCIREMIEAYGIGQFLHNDQSLINLILFLRPSFASDITSRFNFMNAPDMIGSAIKLKINPATGFYAPFADGHFPSILHWTGRDKPWSSSFAKFDRTTKYQLCSRCYFQFRSISNAAL